MVKVIALGFHDYWRNNWNKFDLFLVTFTIVLDIVINILNSQSGQNASATSLRFVRLSKS